MTEVVLDGGTPFEDVVDGGDTTDGSSLDGGTP